MSENMERNQEQPEAPAEAQAASTPEAVERLSAEVKAARARAEIDEAAAEEMIEEYESKYYGAPDGGKAEQAAQAEPVKKAGQVRDEAVHDARAARAARAAKPAPPPPPPPKPTAPAPRALAAAGQSASMSAEDERLWAALAHASVPLTLALGVFSAGTLVPLLIFAPLVIYFVYRDRSRFVAYHALQAFVMQLVATFGWIGVGVVGVVVLGLAIAVSAVLSIVLVGIPFLIVFVLALVLFVIAMVVALPALAIYALWAAVETYNGRDFRYKWISEWVDRYL